MSIIEPEGWQLIEAVDSRVKGVSPFGYSGDVWLASGFRGFLAELLVTDPDGLKASEQKTIWQLAEPHFARSGVDASQFESARGILSSELACDWVELMSCVTLFVQNSGWRRLRKYISDNLTESQLRLIMQFILVEEGRSGR